MKNIKLNVRWRNLFNCGFGVIQIDKSKLPDTLSFVEDFTRSDLRGLNIKHISKEALKFLGKWNSNKQKFESVYLEKYERWKTLYLTFIDTSEITLPMSIEEFISKYNFEIRIAQKALSRLDNF